MTHTYPTLSPMQKRLIRQSFGKVSRTPGELSTLFYDHLSQNTPQLYATLKNNPKRSRYFPMESLALLVTALDALDNLRSRVIEFVSQPENEQLTIEQYDLIGQAILWALEHSLVQDYSNEVEHAWETLHRLIIYIIASAE